MVCLFSLIFYNTFNLTKKFICWQRFLFIRSKMYLFQKILWRQVHHCFCQIYFKFLKHQEMNFIYEKLKLKTMEEINVKAKVEMKSSGKSLEKHYFQWPVQFRTRRVFLSSDLLWTHFLWLGFVGCLTRFRGWINWRSPKEMYILYFYPSLCSPFEKLFMTLVYILSFPCIAEIITRKQSQTLFSKMVTGVKARKKKKIDWIVVRPIRANCQ